MIRNYKESDRIQLFDMIRGLYNEDPYGLPINPEKIEKTIRFSQQHPEMLKLLMITDQEQAVGYSLVNSIWSNEYGGLIMNIDELYIVKEHRGKGLSSQFMIWLEKEGCVAISLECAPENNSSLEYYKKKGFTESHNVHLIKSAM